MFCSKILCRTISLGRFALKKNSNVSDTPDEVDSRGKHAARKRSVIIVVVSLAVAIGCIVGGFVIVLKRTGYGLSDIVASGEVDQVPRYSDLPVRLPVLDDFSPRSLTNPVASSGIPIGPDSPLQVGDRVQAEWAGRWYHVQVLELLADNQVMIQWSDKESPWSELVSRDELQMLSSDDSPQAGLLKAEVETVDQ